MLPWAWARLPATDQISLAHLNSPICHHQQVRRLVTMQLSISFVLGFIAAAGALASPVRKGAGVHKYVGSPEGTTWNRLTDGFDQG